MSDFLNRMKSAAKADLKTIVLPEGEDPRPRPGSGAEGPVGAAEPPGTDRQQ